MLRKLGCTISALGVALVAVVVTIVVISVADTANGPPAGGVAPGAAGTYTIRVSGTKGAVFGGAYVATALDGSSRSRSVDGAVPAEYQVSGGFVSATFQKRDGSPSTLKVEILKGGKVVSQASTEAAYGVAAASGS